MKKGMSSVVTTTLLILFAIITVALVYVSVRNIATTILANQEASSYTLQFEVPLGSVFVNQTSKEVFLTIQRKAGDGALEGFRIVLTNDQGNSETNTSYENFPVAELESLTVHVTYSLPGLITQITVVPIFSTSRGGVVGSQSEQIDISPSGSPGDTTTTQPTFVPPIAPICGNFVVEGNEQCDDGNQNNNDLCTNTCQRTECSDGIDNDEDSWVDSQDLDCQNGGTQEVWWALSDCSDGIDEDRDGLIDSADPQCINAHDISEVDAPSNPACSDGIDNDGDGIIDYPADPGCVSYSDTSEQHTASSQITIRMGDRRLEEINWTASGQPVKRILWDEFTRTRNVPCPVGCPSSPNPYSSPSYALIYLHSQGESTLQNTPAVTYGPKSNPTQFAVLHQDVTYTTQTSAGTISVNTTAGPVRITDKITTSDNRIYQAIIIENTRDETTMITFSNNMLHSLMLGNMDATRRIRPVTGLTRYGFGIENEYNYSTTPKSGIYPSIGTFSPVSLMWDQQTATIAIQLLTKIEAPDSVSFLEFPSNAHSAAMKQDITLELEPHEKRTLLFVYAFAAPQGNWQQAMQPYKNWFDTTYGTTPSYCPTGSLLLFSGGNSDFFNRATQRYNPGTTLKNLYSSNRAQLMRDIGITYFGVWGAAINSGYLVQDAILDQEPGGSNPANPNFGRFEYNAMIKFIDPNIDAGPNATKIKDFVRDYTSNNMKVIWFARPCSAIYGANIQYNAAQQATITKGVPSGYYDVDLRNKTNRDRYLDQMAHLVNQGVSGFYYDATGCPGDEEFFNYAKKKLSPQLTFSMVEGSRDRLTLVSPTIPFMKQGSSPGIYNADLMMMQMFLVPQATYYGGTINNVLFKSEIDDIVNRGFQAIGGPAPTMTTLQQWQWDGIAPNPLLGTTGHNLCNWVQGSYNNQLARYQQYGSSLPGCQAPTSPPTIICNQFTS